MKLPLFRPLRYADHPFVQAVRGRCPQPTGPRVPVLGDLDGLRSHTFDPHRVHRTIRAFYEQPEPGALTLDWLRWEPWALPLQLAYVPAARRMGNLCVPDRVSRPLRMASAVHEVHLSDGGRSRRWERRSASSRSLFYSATLRALVSGGATWLSMAFPLVGAQVLVLLRMRNHGDGFRLSSVGTWGIVAGRRRFVAVPGPPTTERLTVAVDGDSMITLHEDFLFGRRAFAMRYSVAPIRWGSARG